MALDKKKSTTAVDQEGTNQLADVGGISYASYLQERYTPFGLDSSTVSSAPKIRSKGSVFLRSCSFLPLSGVIRLGSYWELSKNVDKFLGQNQFIRLQMVQFECPKVRNPCVSFTFGEIPFPIFSPCSFPPSSLWGNKNWVIVMGSWVKRWIFFL